MIFKWLLPAIFLLSAHGLWSQGFNFEINTTDIRNFQTAFEQISAEPDSLRRIQLIHELYITPGSPGLQGMIRARNYEDHEFVQAILDYPQFWNGILSNTQALEKDFDQIHQNIQKLQAVYPDMQPANLYFPIGVFRSAGTYQKGMVLLGAEFFMPNDLTPLNELPERVQNGIRGNMPFNLPLTALHEIIHTQQKPWENLSIVHICVAEGAAEFISTLLTDSPLSPPVAFGKKNPDRVLQQYMHEIFRDDDVWNWMWNENTNPLGQRDLAYYIGYEICERYYNAAPDKQQAIKDLIQLDYANDQAFGKFLDSTGFLPMTWDQIGAKYESMRPTVTGIKEFKNGSQKVSPKLKVVTIQFSEPMSNRWRNIDYDDTLPGRQLRIQKFIGWSEDGKEFSFEVEDLARSTHYHIIISHITKVDGGNRIDPLTIRFRTKRK